MDNYKQLPCRSQFFVPGPTPPESGGVGWYVLVSVFQEDALCLAIVPTTGIADLVAAAERKAQASKRGFRGVASWFCHSPFLPPDDEVKRVVGLSTKLADDFLAGWVR